MKKIALVTAWLMMAATGWSPVDAAPRARRSTRKVKVKVVPRTPQLVGTITYDTGVNAGFHPDSVAGNLNRFVGNRFNSALGGPLLVTGMASMLTVFPANDGDQSVSIASAPTTMNTAMVLEFLNANLMANLFNAITFTPGVTVGPDFLGLFIGVFAASQPAGLLGMSDMQTMGQGYHAIEGFYFGSALATMIQPVPNRNAMLRATVDILVPVELMDFKIQ